MIENFRISELKVFSEIVQSGSLREVSRTHHIQPSQLSKLIRKMELEFGHPLLVRSAQGMSLTPEGEEFQKKIALILGVADGMQPEKRSTNSKKNEVKLVSIAGPTFVTGSMVAPLLPSLTAELGTSKLRLLSIAQDQMVDSGIKGFFDIAVHVGEIDWPKSWSSFPLGKFYSGLYARKGHPLGTIAKLSEVKNQEFVAPTYLTKNRFYYGTDGCPLAVRDRLIGSEVSSADLAISVAIHSDQLAFVPELIARKEILTGRIQQVKVREWGDVFSPLYLSVKADRVTQQLQRVLVKGFKAQLTL